MQAVFGEMVRGGRVRIGGCRVSPGATAGSDKAVAAAAAGQARGKGAEPSAMERLAEQRMRELAVPTTAWLPKPAVAIPGADVPPEVAR